MLGRSRKPHAVVCGRIKPIAEDQNDLFSYINRQTAEHPSRGRCQARDCVEYKLVGCDAGAFDGEERVVEGMAATQVTGSWL
jgi:hypothetical protein